MGRRSQILVFVAAVVIGVCAIIPVLPSSRYDVRDRPLQQPLIVAAVDDGAIRLVDGRTFRIARVTLPSDAAARETAERFIRLATAQGVEVRSDLGDGSAFLICEPRFYNWCGTSRVKGMYVPCGLSELLVACGYGTVGDQAGVTNQDQARLSAAAGIARDRAGSYDPVPFPDHGIRYDGFARWLGELDEYIEVMGEQNRP